MAAPSRSNQFANLHKFLKKYYKPVAADAKRTVLEHYLFGCVLENAHFAVAEETLAALVDLFFDYNEIRVSSIRELAEVLARLPDPPAAANRVKRALQHVFEDGYSFDLEGLRKKNLGPAVDSLKAIDGATNFVVAYVVQSALGGHAIALDAGTLEVMRILDMATDQEVKEGTISGLERAIPKNKGVEFASLLHQLGAEFTENPFAVELRDKLLAIEPSSKNRLPKRHTRRKHEPETSASAPEAAPAAKTDATKSVVPAAPPAAEEPSVKSAKPLKPVKKAPPKKTVKKPAAPAPAPVEKTKPAKDKPIASTSRKKSDESRPPKRKPR